MFTHVRWFAGLVVISLPWAWGCGDSGPGGAGASAQGEATVTGKVTIKGKAATKGVIVFEPRDARGVPVGERTAGIQSDGTYEVKTLVGQNVVTISGTGNPIVDGAYNQIHLDIVAGANTKDFQLPITPE